MARRQQGRDRYRDIRAAEEEAFDVDDIFLNGKIPYIDVSLEGVTKARTLLTRTKIVDDDDKQQRHRAIGCVVCDEFIIGTEEQCNITKDQLLEHRERLGVESYEEYHGEMDEVLQKQYEIKGLEGILLSRRFGKDDANQFTVCSSCKKALNSNSATSKNPPKYSIANGFAIGAIPETIEFKDNEDEHMSSMKTVLDHHDKDGNVTQIKESKITSIMAAAVSPVRPYAYIFAYHGGQHKSLMGNVQFFETSQTKLAGALNCLNQSGMTSNIYVVLTGRMTPTQKEIVRKKAELDKDLYFALLKWLKAHHPRFRDVEIDESSDPKIELIEDPSSDSNTDTVGDPEMEKRDDGAIYFFSSAGDPTKETSVYKTSKELVLALLQDHSAPTLTIHGGEYVGHREVMKLENVFPTAFPFGSGGATQKRRSQISSEEKIRHYLRLSLPQFMESEFVLVANFLLGRILSYRTAIMKCRPIIDEHGTSVADIIGAMSIEDIKNAMEEEEESSSGTRVQDSTASKLLKAVSASCKELGHTKEAAQQARRRCFALQEYFGMHSLFVTITIDDECSFRVRLYPFADGNGDGVSN